MTVVPSPRLRITPVQWVICVVAAIGFAFDIYALLVLPLIVRPALMELGRLKPGTPEFNGWVGLLFYVPAIAGGIFGMLGGYLTDLFGRRRVLVWSILLYAFSALAAGFSTSLPMLLFLRCTHLHRRLAWNSWPRWPGWPSCFPIPSSAKPCSDIRRRSPRSAE